MDSRSSPPGVAAIHLPPALVLQHAPTRARAAGREAALVDIAQDLLLRELCTVGLMEHLVFKGGTALRKLYAGNEGRFSLDLDFALAEIGTDREDVLTLLTEHVSGLEIGPFAYDIRSRRGKRHLVMRAPSLGEMDSLSSKLDVSSPPWLEPVVRSWVHMPIHDSYGHPPLPALPVVRLEENLAEKISRLNRLTPARDMYDLAWIARNHLRKGLDLDLVRRLAVLKVWVDANGVSTHDTTWKPSHKGAVSFDAQPEGEPFETAHRKRVGRRSATAGNQHCRCHAQTLDDLSQPPVSGKASSRTPCSRPSLSRALHHAGCGG